MMLRTLVTIALFALGTVAVALLNDPATIMAHPKILYGCITAGLGFAALGYYILQTLWGPNRPDPYSWLIWFVANSVAWYNQHSHDAGPGAWSTLVMSGLSGIIFVLAVYKRRKQPKSSKITPTDFFSLVIVAASLALLFVPHSGPSSTIMATLANVLAFLPTLVKAWREPHSETPVNYVLNTHRQFISLLAIESRSMETMLFPVVLGVSNALTVAVIAGRRRKLRT